MSALPIVESLRTAMPYIRAYRGATFVVKLGGGILSHREALSDFAAQIALLEHLSVRPIIVHGGGPQATKLQERLGIRAQIIAGRRVTDAETLEVTKMIYGGLLNIEMLSALRAHHVPAVGVSGLDGNLVRTTRRAPIRVIDDEGSEREVDFGFVGDVNAGQIDARLLHILGQADFVPVLASLAADDAGNVLNINADVLAAELAIAVKATKLIFLTEVPGLLREPPDIASLVPFADPADIDALRADGVIKGGMGPKVEACVRAATNGVARTHIINGLAHDSLLTELFTAEGCGTMIVGEREKAAYQEGG
ncbi:acetylglutamate kinase [bacterium]|nr:acetylglutamate kinase [bacterium]